MKLLSPIVSAMICASTLLPYQHAQIRPVAVKQNMMIGGAGVFGLLTFVNTAGTAMQPFMLGAQLQSAGESIHYTVDGSTPTCSSPVYSTADTFSTTIRAVACVADTSTSATKGYNSILVSTAPNSQVSISAASPGQNSNLNGYKPFYGSSPYADITAYPVDATNDTYFKAYSNYATASLNPNFQSGADFPYYVINSVTDTSIRFIPSHSTGTTGYNTESDDVPIPYKAGMMTEGGKDPSTCYADDGADHHLTILDQGTSFLYEIYQAKTCNGIMQTYATSVWDLTLPIEGQHPKGRTSADAAGLPVFPGVLGVRYEDVAAGHIDHALRMTLPHSSCGFYTNGDAHGLYVSPASHAACNGGGTRVAFFGERLRLKASTNIAGYSAANQVILTAMKKYGIINADLGCTYCFQGTYDPRFDFNDLGNLAKIKGSDFEVVQTGTVVGAELTPEDITGGTSVVNDQTQLYDSTIKGPAIANSPPPPTIQSFTAASNNVALGYCTMLTAVAKNATLTYTDHGGPFRGTAVVCPQQTTTYVLTALGTNGYATTVNAPVTITVNGPTVATPTAISPAGTYTSTQSVALATTTSGAAIHYTTDGSTPTTSSSTYTDPLSISANTTVKAMGTAAANVNSAVMTSSYVINIPGATPSFVGASAPKSFTDSTSVSQTYTFTAGNTAFLTLAWVNTKALPTSVTCNGTPATPLPAILVNNDPNPWTLALYRIVNVKSGPQTCTATWSTSVYSSLYVSEVSGTPAIDAISAGRSINYPLLSCGTLITTGTNRLAMVFGLLPGDNLTADAGYTQFYGSGGMGGEWKAIASPSANPVTIHVQNSGTRAVCLSIALRP